MYKSIAAANECLDSARKPPQMIFWGVMDKSYPSYQMGFDLYAEACIVVAKLSGKDLMRLCKQTNRPLTVKGAQRAINELLRGCKNSFAIIKDSKCMKDPTKRTKECDEKEQYQNAYENITSDEMAEDDDAYTDEDYAKCEEYESFLKKVFFLTAGQVCHNNYKGRENCTGEIKENALNLSTLKSDLQILGVESNTLGIVTCASVSW